MKSTEITYYLHAIKLQTPCNNLNTVDPILYRLYVYIYEEYNMHIYLGIAICQSHSLMTSLTCL